LFTYIGASLGAILMDWITGWVGVRRSRESREVAISGRIVCFIVV
jgi:hypothetical protein